MFGNLGCIAGQHFQADAGSGELMDGGIDGRFDGVDEANETHEQHAGHLRRCPVETARGGNGFRGDSQYPNAVPLQGGHQVASLIGQGRREFADDPVELDVAAPVQDRIGIPFGDHQVLV